MASLDEVAIEVRQLAARHERIVVGIDGFGGAGKSTLAAALADTLGGVVVAIDDFIVKDRVDDLSWEAVWDRERLVRQVLEPFRAGREVWFQRLEWVPNRLSAPVRLADTHLMILEGITTLDRGVRRFIDYAIWVEAPIEVASARGRARDAGTENEERWDAWSANDLAYAASLRPSEWVDAVVTTG